MICLRRFRLEVRRARFPFAWLEAEAHQLGLSFLIEKALYVGQQCMMRHRRARFFEATVAIVALLAWFTGTHHCLLQPMATPRGRTVSCCHCSTAATGPGSASQSPCRTLGCCQGLLSSAVKQARTKAHFAPLLLESQVVTIDRLLQLPWTERIAACMARDTGPPLQSCFVRIVLRHSLRENAPPHPV